MSILSLPTRLLGTIAVTAVLLAPTVFGQAPSTAKKPVTGPRTSWGDPDLRGYWTAFEDILTPLERPTGDKRVVQTQEEALQLADERGGPTGAGPKNWYETRVSPRLSLVTDPKDGRLPPMTPLAQQMRSRLREQMMRPPESHESVGIGTRCITRGPGGIFPNGFMYNTAIQILQIPGFVVIHFEMFDTRIIPLDGGPHLSPGVHLWMGDSRGHWDGNTLVVDVTNFSAKTPVLGGISSEKLHLVERFTRVGKTLNYEMTVDDPDVFTQPWKAGIPLTGDDKYRMFEYACHEGNHAVLNILRITRAAESKGAGEPKH
jgi:hypothetical protein